MHGQPTLGFFLFFTAFILCVLRFFVSDGRLTAGAVLALIIAGLLGMRW